MSPSFDWSQTSLGPREVWPQVLRTVYDTVVRSPCPMVILWGTDGILLYNDGYAEIAGARHPQLLGAKVREGWPEAADFNDRVLRAGLAGETLSFKDHEFTLLRNGAPERVWLNLDYSPIVGEQGEVLGVLAVLLETTQRVLSQRHREAAEADLKAERDRARDALDNMAEAFVLLDHEFRIADVNAEALRYSRKTRGEMLAVNCWTAFPTIEPELRQTIAEAMHEQRAVSVEHLHRRSNGQAAWVDLRAFPVASGLAVFFKDVTERHEALAILAQREYELQTLTDALPVLISYVDSERRYRFANKAYERWFPVSRESMLGRRVVDVVGEAAYSAVVHHMDAALKGERVTFEQFMPYGASGDRYVEVEYVPRRGQDGAVEGFYALVQDVTARRQALTALQEGEARFRNMADHSPVMMWVTDARGDCIYLNKLWYEFTGQAEAEALGLGWTHAVHPDEQQMAEDEFLRATRQQSPFRIEYRLRRSDGVYRWAIDAAAPRFGGKGEFLGFVGSVIDIDERREAEIRLRLSEESLRLATEAADVGTWDLDLHTHVLTWSDRTKAAFGISPGAPCSMDDFYACLHPDDLDATSAAFAHALDPRQRLDYEVEYRTIGKEDGAIRWVAAKGRGLFDEAGRCVRALGTAIDITHRKAIEARLLTSEASLRQLNETLEAQVASRTGERNLLATIVETTDALIQVCDFEFNLLAINKASAQEFERIYGVRPKVGDHLPALLSEHPEQMAVARDLWARAFAGDEFTFVQAFGDPALDRRYYEIKFNTLRNDAGERIGAYQFVYDVTERLRDQMRLAETQEALRQSQKLEAMGQLTGGVAHDFNNLLTPIIGSLDMLQRRGDLDARLRRLVDGGLQSAERAKTLVQRLLAFARRQPLQPTAVDVVALVAGMADLVASTSGPAIKVMVDAQDDVPAARADPNQLEMALLNLAVNARDAMPGGGVLRISTSWAVASAGEDSKLPAGPYVRIRVADTGTGMDDATLARAVEPFFSTKGIGQGTGLGLSMVHGLASQLNGGLFIDSAPGRGTIIDLWLPVAEGTTQPSLEAARARDAVAVRGSVLLVDDEELVRATTADMLIDLGFAVVEAASAEEALRLTEAGHRPDILVTDHLMPGLNGVQLIERMRRIIPGLPALLVSGYAETEGLGTDVPRLSKPFRQADLAESVSRIVEASTG